MADLSEGHVEQVEVGSEMIDSIAYDATSGACEVRFASGRRYRYAGVPPSVFEWWKKTPSKGAFFNRKVRDVYPFEELREPAAEQDLAALLEASLAVRDGERSE